MNHNVTELQLATQPISTLSSRKYKERTEPMIIRKQLTLSLSLSFNYDHERVSIRATKQQPQKGRRTDVWSPRFTKMARRSAHDAILHLHTFPYPKCS